LKLAERLGTINAVSGTASSQCAGQGSLNGEQVPFCGYGS
jgi:hypothetical protein